MEDGVTSEVSEPAIIRAPDKFKNVGRKGLALVYALAREGKTNTAIAEALRISRGTFALIIQRQPEVEEALARGRAAMEVELTDILMRHAREGNVVSAIYLTKARCGWREGEPIPGIVQNTQININMPAPLTDAQFAALSSPQKAEIIDAETVR